MAGQLEESKSVSFMQSEAKRRAGKDVVKRLFDIGFSIAVLAVIWPLLIIVALAIKVESKGPVIFKQRREGKNRKVFMIYKFRSMKVHEEQGVTQASKNDKRITRIGAFIRKTSIDELPQFVNVLLGDMSLVGPRPHAIAHNDYYRKKIDGYSIREKVKPGITGWAQVQGFRGETDTLEKMNARVILDSWYVENRSLAIDVKIVFMTPFCLFSKNAY